MRLLFLALLGGPALAAGCQPSSPDASPLGPSPLPAIPKGVIAGRAFLHGEDPTLAADPLMNVFVYIQEGLEGRTFPLPDEPVVLSQVSYQFLPHVFGLRAGQTLKITSQDPAPHNVFCQPFNNPGFNVSMTTGQVVEKTFSVPEIMVLFQCHIHHHMKAYAGVLHHPFFAVTGRDGHFEIRGIPPGRYKVAGWHESHGTYAAEVVLGEKEGTEITFLY